MRTRSSTAARILALIALFGTACDGDAAKPPAGARTSTTATPAGSSPTAPDAADTTRMDIAVAPVAPAAGRPKAVLAISEDARLVVLDPATGEELRDLLDRGDVVGGNREFPLETVTLSPDGDVAYFIDVRKNGTHAVSRIATEGGPVEVLVAPAAAPSISPDGRYLAYSFPADGNPQTNANAIGVLDLKTMQKEAWRLDKKEKDFFQVGGHIYATSWSPEGDRLAYYLDYEGPETRVLDFERHESLSDAAFVEGPYAWPAWVSERELVVVKSCCFPEYRKIPGRAVVVGARTGRVHRQLPSQGTVEAVDADASGRRFLLVLDDGTLEVVTPGGAAVLATGYTAAAW